MRIVDPDRGTRGQRDEPHLLAVARDPDRVWRRSSRGPDRTRAQGRRRCSLRRCAWASSRSPCGGRTRPSGSSAPSVHLPLVYDQHLLQHPVDLGVDAHPAVAGADLHLVCVGVQACPPIDDPVAARIDRRRRDGRREGGGKVAAKSAQHSPSAQARENVPGSPNWASIATERTSRRTGAETASGSSTGEPSVTKPVTRSGWRTARERASVPPRLCPITIAGAPASWTNASRWPRSRVIARSAQSTLSRIPLIATEWPRAPSQARSTTSDASPAMNPGISRIGGAPGTGRGGRSPASATRPANSKPQRASPSRDGKRASSGSYRCAAALIVAADPTARPAGY